MTLAQKPVRLLSPSAAFCSACFPSSVKTMRYIRAQSRRQRRLLCRRYAGRDQIGRDDRRLPLLLQGLRSARRSSSEVRSFSFVGFSVDGAGSAFIAVSAFGNVASVTFSTSRLNQELAKEGILPFSRLAASSWPAGAPLAGLIVSDASYPRRRSV